MILLHVKLTSSTLTFKESLLCCKAWRDAALPLLYGHILLATSNLDAFQRTFNIAHAPFVRSLTVIIDSVQLAKDLAAPYPNAFLEDEEDMKRNGSEESRALWQSLRRAPDKLVSMVNLETFSLTVSPEPRTIGFWIPRPVIAQVIKALPEACVNLEIDARGNDYFEPGSGHVCDTLRGMLPRLRHLRLRLSTLCPAILGSGFNPDEIESLSSFVPLAAPFLQTLVVNCIPRTIFGSQAHICGTFKENPYTAYATNLPEARVAIVDALCLAKKASMLPVAESISVLHALPHSNSDQSVYASLNRCDILKSVTWALPFRNIMGSQMDSFLIRTPEGREYLSYPWAIEALAEGGLWCETVNGFRLPTFPSTRVSSSHIDKDLPLLDTETWKLSNPRKSCMLWLNEKVSSIQLLSAECRQGLSDITAVRERTPAGWTRSNDGGQLQEI